RGAAGSGGESVEGNDGIGEVIGKTGGNSLSAAEHGGFCRQRCCLYQSIPTTGGDSFGKEKANDLQLALHLVVHRLRKRLIRIGVNLVRASMDQRDRDAFLVERAAHIGVQGYYPDAANGPG